MRPRAKKEVTKKQTQTNEPAASSEPQPASTPLYAPIVLRAEARRVYRPTMERSKDEVPPPLRRSIREMTGGWRRWPVYIFGPVGVGKTAAVLTLIDQVEGSKYMTAAEMMVDVRAARSKRLVSNTGHDISERELLRRWTESTLLVIDEVGQRRDPTAWTDETIQRVLDDRIDKPTILIGNHDLADLAKVMDDRVVSRLSAGTIIHVDGEDRRPAMGTIIHIDDRPKPKRRRRPPGAA